MEMVKHDRLVLCSDTLSISQYKRILDVIQDQHPFADIHGANVKYIDSEVTITTVKDTRDSSAFTVKIGMRALGDSVVFSQGSQELLDMMEENPGEDPYHQREYSGKSMFETITEYLERNGSNRKAFSASSIGRLKGAKCIFGAYSGKYHMHDIFPGFAAFLSVRHAKSTHLFELYRDDELTGYLAFDNDTRDALIFNTDQQLIFAGRLECLDDMLTALRLVGVRTSY
tara:strand:- start:70711 stop:71394 length:684 start_codon:yes stop_codon:yes gene_type:complete